MPMDERLRLTRPYARVARDAMRSTLLSRMAAAGVVRVKAGVNAATVTHDGRGSSFNLSDGAAVQTKLLVDCSGHKSQLVQRDGTHDPAYQIAYGIECEIAGEATSSASSTDLPAQYSFVSLTTSAYSRYCR